MPADLNLLPGGLQDKGQDAPTAPPSSDELKRSLCSTFAQIVEQTVNNGVQIEPSHAASPRVGSGAGTFC